MYLTNSIYITKRSSLNKLERFCKRLQHFKNIIYLIALECKNNNLPLSIFTNKFMLENFVKKKLIILNQTDKIFELQEQLYLIWKNELGTNVIQSLCNDLAIEFKGILSNWKNGNKASLPKPRKLDRLYKFTFKTNKDLITDKRNLKRKPSNHIVIRLGKKFGHLKIKIPQFGVYRKCIMLSWYKDAFIAVKLLYEYPETNLDLNKENFLSIDLGINNFASIISNVENLSSILINGKPLKSFNQWYNKTLAKLQSENKLREIRLLNRYRNDRINYFFNSTCNFIIGLCLKYDIGTIIISDSLCEEYSKQSNKGKKFNQMFRFIPFGKFIEKLKYKTSLFGINLKIVKEKYTSKTSSLTGCIEKREFNGKRIKRGLFLDTKINKVFNADLNGALNIAKIALGKKVLETFSNLKNLFKKLCNPIKLNIFNKYSPNLLLKEIGDSKSCPFGQRRHLLNENKYMLTFVNI